MSREKRDFLKRNVDSLNRGMKMRKNHDGSPKPFINKEIDTLPVFVLDEMVLMVLMDKAGGEE